MLAESQTLLARREQAGPGVARALDITPGDAVIHWKRLRRADQQVVCIEDAYLNEVLLPGFLQSGMPTSLYDALEARGLRPTWAEDSICADAADRRGGRRCSRSTPGAPVLRHSRRALCGDKVVEVSRTVYRPDRLTIFVQLGDRPGLLGLSRSISARALARAAASHSAPLRRGEQRGPSIRSVSTAARPAAKSSSPTCAYSLRTPAA